MHVTCAQLVLLGGFPLPSSTIPARSFPAAGTWRRAGVVTACALVLAACSGAAAPTSTDAPTSGAADTTADAGDTVVIEGLEPDAMLNADDVAATTVTITARAAAKDVTVTIDGVSATGPATPTSTATSPDAAGEATTGDEPATDEPAADEPTTRDDGTTIVTVTGNRLAELADGTHVLEVTAGADTLLRNPTTTSLTFTLDTTPPQVELPDTIEAAGLADPLELTFTTTDASEVTAVDAEVTHADGTGTATWPHTPAEVTVTAFDTAGNQVTATAPVIVSYPGGRAVHTTPSAWQHEPKRTPIIEMVEAGLIDAVQLDVKDEAGDIGFDSDVPLANDSGADAMNENFDAAAAVQQIHDLGARVIGRLVVYKDTKLAQWAWENDRRDMVTQTTDGQPFTGSYGEFAFTNPANPEVQQYNVDIAMEAAALGFDDILYDYIRRPDGALDAMVFPGIGERTPEEAVVEVMATAYPLLRDQGVWVGASVFGIAITRPLEIAQDVPAMAPHLDYVSPMVYPNHWGPGEYGLSSPVDAPYEIVQQSLADFQDVLEPTGTVVMPWLQDFGGYGEAEVRAQIDATTDATGNEWFILWNSGANYTTSALDPIGPEGP